MAITVRAPGKINVALRVGPLDDDGFHAVTTVYQAVSVFDEVTVETADELTVVVRGDDAHRVPADASNLAARAAALVASEIGRAPDVRLTITKRIPVAGGMAGGSADAAAALVACDLLWGARLERTRLVELAAQLGSDVPFCLAGGTALGTGRGDRLAPALVRGEWHWVLALADGGLGAGEVYAQLDRLREGHAVPLPPVDVGVTAALATGDPEALGPALVNDLQPAAVALRPGLRATLDAGRELGALGGLVSGSGPTCAFLVRDAAHALDLAVGLAATGACRSVERVTGPVPGAQRVP